MYIDYNNKSLKFSDLLEIRFDEICDGVHAGEKDVVYIGGSLVEGQINQFSAGMGNKFSDIDIFIIRDHDAFVNTEAVYDDNVRKTFFCEKKQIGFDVEVYDKDFVVALIEALNKVEMNPNERINNIFQQYLPDGNSLDLLNTFLCRLHNSICLKGEALYREIQDSMKYQKFLDIMTNKTIVSIDNIYDDVRGNLEVGQLDVALYCVRRIILSVMFVALMKNGVFADREKWIPLKFKNLCMMDNSYAELKKVFDVLFRGNLLDDESCIKSIESAMMISKDVIEAILIEELKL